ncbi:hypothetical protein PORY_000652 [Pneumocystis oryctolagi]|uniref:Uncharacterized protein n=1 Tax=Pneumocystis oryctolagi TaxID=42067 RepID=A0ACB7CGJ9_9ASCO|nr:hypothetical protein PORY_000652 [Pneumocystis oryctolagi]
MIEVFRNPDFQGFKKSESRGVRLSKKRSISTLEEGENFQENSSSTEKHCSPDKLMNSSLKIQHFGIFVGAHVSAAKGVHNAVLNNASIGGNAFAMFLKSQRKWTAPELKQQDIDYFKRLCKEYGYDLKKHVLPHGSYLVNLANSDKEKRDKAYMNFIDDVKRCEKLGIGKFNFHPGSCGTSTREDGIKHLTDCINRAHKEVNDVVLVIENMAGQGNTLGNSFEELATILDKVEDKSRIGICLDTCHLFASGYDIRTKESYDNVMDEFQNKIGFKYLAGVHLNDSKTPLGSKRDLHANIGCGYIGLEAFRVLINDKRMQGIPLILETPSSILQKRINFLELYYNI